MQPILAAVTSKHSCASLFAPVVTEWLLCSYKLKCWTVRRGGRRSQLVYCCYLLLAGGPASKRRGGL